MRVFLRMVVISLASLGISVPANAQKPSVFGGEIQARSFSKLWYETCAHHVGLPKAKQLVVMLDNNKRFLKNPDYAAQILDGKKGTVWDASEPDNNIVQAVTVYEAEKIRSLRCQVHIRKVNTKSARKFFDDLMPKLASVGTQVKASETQVNIGAARYQQKIFNFYRKDNAANPRFVLKTSESPDASWQAIMSQSIE